MSKVQIGGGGSEPPDDNKGYRRIYQVEEWRQRAREELAAKKRAPTKEPPNRQSLAAFLEEIDEEITWRVEGLWPAGENVVLAAAFKAGKTSLIANLIKALADGGKGFLGQFKTNKPRGRIALVDCEMSPRMLRRWYRDMRIKNAELIDVYSFRGRASTFNILDETIRKMWAERFRAYGISLLAIDCLRPLMDALGLEEATDAGVFFVALDQLVEEAGIDEVFLAHHMGHRSERSRGDSRIRDWPSVEWSLVRQNEKASSPRFLEAFGRDVSLEESQLAFDETTRVVSLVGGSRAQAARSEVLNAVLAFLKETGEPRNGGQIAEALRGSFAEKRVRDTLKRAAAGGELCAAPGRQTNERLYTLPPAEEVPF